ncbi:MAG: PD-(D/E)XK nuclease family protein [Deltaproteobacteria bacterium]|nr:PD-(D/E)XK nuclease family protein [Deltaproteobacteria bacterium]
MSGEGGRQGSLDFGDRTALEPSSRLLLLGRAGSGKSTRIRELYLAAVDEFGPGDVYLVLATASMRDHTRVLLARERGAVADADILTFDGLIRRHADVLEPAAEIVNPGDTLDALRALIAEIAPGTVLEAVAGLPNFAATTLASFAQWIDEGVSAEGIRTATKGDARERLGAAMADLFERYLADLAGRGLRLRRMALDALAARWRDPACAPRAIFFDGFYDLTAGQTGVLNALLTHSTLRVGFSLPGLRADMDSGRHGFLAVRRMRDRLTAAGFVVEERHRKEDERQPALRQLEDALFAETSLPPVDAEPVAILNVDHPGFEADVVAERVAALIRNGADPLRIGIVCRNLSDYARVLPDALARRGVPFRFLGRLDAASTGPGRFVLAALDVLGRRDDQASFDPSGRDELFALVRQLATVEEAAPLDQAAMRDTGPWHSKPDEWAKYFREKRRAEACVELLEQFAAIRDGLRRVDGAAATAKVGRALLALVTRRLFQYRGGVMSRPEATLAAAALSALHGALGRVEAFADGHEDAAGWIGALREEWASAAVALPGQAASAVHVVDALEARSWAWRHVFLLNLTQGGFPTRPASDPFLSDAIHARLVDAGLGLKSEAEHRDEESLLFYLSVTRADASVTLTYPRRSSDGRRNEPSPYLTDVAKALGVERKEITREGARTLVHPTAFDANRPDAANEADAWRYEAALRAGRFARVGTSVSRDDGAWARLFEADILPMNFAFDLARYLDGPPRRLDDAAALTALVAAMTDFSASQIAQFVGCPFQHFVEHVIGAKEPGAPRSLADGRFRGHLVHKALEVAFPESRTGALAAALRKELAEAAPHLHPDEDVTTRHQLNELITKTYAFAREENERLAAHPDFTPTRSEERFNDLMIRGGGAEYKFRGRIDRRDVNDKLGASIVIDYKTGSEASFPKDDAKLADQLLQRPQLPIYLLAVERFFHQKPAGAAYLLVRHRGSVGLLNADLVDGGGEGFAGRFFDDDTMRQVLAQFEQDLAATCARVHGGDVGPDYENGPCKWCTLATLCRKAR